MAFYFRGPLITWMILKRLLIWKLPFWTCCFKLLIVEVRLRTKLEIVLGAIDWIDCSWFKIVCKRVLMLNVFPLDAIVFNWLSNVKTCCNWTVTDPVTVPPVISPPLPPWPMDVEIWFNVLVMFYSQNRRKILLNRTSHVNYAVDIIMTTWMKLRRPLMLPIWTCCCILFTCEVIWPIKLMIVLGATDCNDFNWAKMVCKSEVMPDVFPLEMKPFNWLNNEKTFSNWMLIDPETIPPPPLTLPISKFVFKVFNTFEMSEPIWTREMELVDSFCVTSCKLRMSVDRVLRLDVLVDTDCKPLNKLTNFGEREI